MWDWIVKWINKIALINVVTPRRALESYLKAMLVCDTDGNGELSVKEIAKGAITNFKELIFAPEMEPEEIHKLVDAIISKEK